MALVPARSDLVVISDFLWDEDRIDAFLKTCASRPCEPIFSAFSILRNGN